MKERSLVIYKPDIVARGLIGEITNRFEKVGFKIVAMKMLQADEITAAKHYEKDDEWLVAVGSKLIKNMNLSQTEDPKVHGQKICDSLAKDICLYPVIALVIEGHNAIAKIRKMLGGQSPEISNPGTIRFDYSSDTFTLANVSNRPVITLVHASDSVENAKREIALWFDKSEIFEWTKPDEVIHFRKNI